MPNLQVGCKIRQGMVMELVEPGLDDKGNIGIQPVPITAETKRVHLKGPNRLRIATTAPNPTSEDFVITEVEETFARAWFKRYAKMPFVANGQIFIQEKAADAKAQAKDLASVETGFEPLNPKGDKRTGLIKPDAESMPTLSKMGIV